jgi:hypothetical protein
MLRVLSAATVMIGCFADIQKGESAKWPSHLHHRLMRLRLMLYLSHGLLPNLRNAFFITTKAILFQALHLLFLPRRFGAQS